MSNNNRIKGKIILRGQIECLSPVHIGSGKVERSDMDILLDSNDKPFIPATGFVGVLRHAIQKQTTAETEEPERFKNFWGYTENDDGRQSALCCSDLTLAENSSPEVIIRDGIRICHKTGIVEKGGKFDFELLERGSRFGLNMEFTFRENDEVFVKQTARTIYNLLANEQIRIGAKTNSGFGRIALVKDAITLYLFDFLPDGNGSPKEDVCNWLLQNFSEQNAIAVADLGEPFGSSKRRFTITAQLRLKNSLLVRSYTGDPQLSDTTQLKSRQDWVIPGTSLKGAIRARAERIANTLELKNAESFIKKLFGHVDDKSRSQNVMKGRVRIQEITLTPADFPTELQTRIRVDRFTGGVIEGGLFDSMPIFAPTDDKLIELYIEIENHEIEEQEEDDEFLEAGAGLLLLVLKDLWCGDLALGGEKNIGRGVLQGARAEIAWDDEKIVLENDLSTLKEDEKVKLQNFVDALFGEQTNER